MGHYDSCYEYEEEKRKTEDEEYLIKCVKRLNSEERDMILDIVRNKERWLGLYMLLRNGK